ncbi:MULTISPECIES: helix-turn-helix domain-containing protein [unclassified Leeuwenhoekiella]|uniref:helix-turn-helix transcriptional regulator n=1 Tax=unclassified Leeuwenhoekiella TaxID=2615029 RepID=UPI000C56E70D|nr:MULTISPECIES: helix-turn-helix domain-containing protein [unclassified Leeuwenhoekiella]MAW96454.1 transcriptional regulator [Leeuwenhoekiella sp.]MBA81341.1 transcriptional regulator [Leeuwenhoekiella sp.]|tara:strand:- start:23244 stop:23528 length:285 start_codon:yes stop_codon:yes gene_type:complete
MNNINLDERLARIESLLLANKKVLTLDEACDYTGMSRSYLYRLTSSGIIPHSKPSGKLVYFEREALEQWLLQNKKNCETSSKDSSTYSKSPDIS